MTKKVFLHRLLHEVFVQIREDSLERGDEESFHLANIFHGLPLNVLFKKDGIEELFQNLEKNIATFGLEGWYVGVFDIRNQDGISVYPNRNEENLTKLVAAAMTRIKDNAKPKGNKKSYHLARIFEELPLRLLFNQDTEFLGREYDNIDSEISDLGLMPWLIEIKNRIGDASDA
jgi:hypothetical protein